MQYLENILSKERAERKNNKLRALIKAVWEKGCVTRNCLAEELNVSKVSVRNDTEKLLEYNVLQKCLPEGNGNGRKPTPLKLNPELFYSFGVYTRNEKISLVLLDSNLNPVESLEWSNSSKHANEVYGFICSQISEIMKKRSIEKERLTGIGVSVPGILDYKRGFFLSSSAFPDDKEFNIIGSIRSRLGNLPVFLVNDADLLAVAEKKWGKAEDMSNFLYFTCGYGLGIFMNGRICQGHQGGAGEISFMRLSETGERGPDGRTGTLISLKKFSEIPSIVKKALCEGGHSLAETYLSGSEKELTFDMILKAAGQKDPLCVQVLSEYFEVIGEAVLNLAYILNPEAVFLDPWTALCPEATVDIVKKKMTHYGIHNWCLSCKIEPAELGKDDLARGAAFISAAEYFNFITQLA